MRMSKDTNIVIFTGNLGKDPELKQIGTGLTSFSICVDRSWKDKASGDIKTSSMWIQCKAWGKLGSDVIMKIARKGSKVFVSGRLEIAPVENNGERRDFVSVVVEDFHLLSRNSVKEDATPSTPPAPPPNEDFPFSFD